MSFSTFSKLSHCSLIIILLLNSLNNFAQRGQRPQLPEGKGLLVGRVIDSYSEEALEFCSISIYDAKSNKLITGGITDTEGRFKIELSFGQYYGKVDYMGYNPYRIKNFSISKEKPFTRLRQLRIEAKADLIDEVEVKGEKELFTNKIDSKTFNVAKDITMKSKTALEALEQIPSLSVDMDGNVSLRGNSNVRILINDRPISVTAENQAAILEQIQADNIEAIDVITNPSAKYDPQGMSGIINIQLKKDQPAGKNLSVSLSSDFYQQYSANISGGIRTKKVNLFASYGYRDSEFEFNRNSYQNNFFADTNYYINQVMVGLRGRKSHMGTIGMDYNISKKTRIGFEGLASVGDNIKESPFYYTFLDESQEMFLETKRRTDNISDRLKLDLQLNFKHQFNNAKHYIDGELSITKNDNSGHLDYYEWETFPINGDTITLEESNDNGNNTFYRYRTAYHYPYSKTRTLEIGADGLLRDDSRDFEMNVFNPTSNAYENDIYRSDKYAYFDQTHALYGLYNDKIGKFTYQIGLRLEYNAYRFDIENIQEDSLHNYRLNYYPSVHTSYKIDENSELALSYSKRVHRPSIRSLNPIRSYTNAYSYRVGNPNLAPENIHSTELSYSKRIGKLRLMPAIYYKYIDQVIKKVKDIDTTGIGVVTYQNLDFGSSFGTELIVNYNPTSWLNLMASGNLGYSIIKSTADPSLDNENFGWSSKLNSFISLPWKIKLQVAYHYHGQRVVPQGYIAPMHWLDIGLRKSFLKDKASLSIRASDMFRTRRFGIFIEADNYTNTLQFQRMHAIVSFSFTYQIGQKERKRKKSRSRGESDSDDMGL